MEASEEAVYRKYLEFWEPQLEQARNNLPADREDPDYEKNRAALVKLEDSVNRVRGLLGMDGVGGGDYRDGPPPEEPAPQLTPQERREQEERRQRVLEAQKRYLEERDANRLRVRIWRGLQIMWHWLVKAYHWSVSAARRADHAISEGIASFFPPYGQ